ncbi:helix-turn-helix domain-containing protein [Bacillus sp. HY001]|uniref:helix-turn-helix domain-containing protein n=1 Tax=Bacillus TaxID=1386 RepID=UPI001186B537|nr:MULTISPECIES: helix-turn-helix domain-containing protein [Bacillus]TSI12490.1 helix-turn-helix domain-containing protein [Bacillus sp. HY001]
MEKLEKLLSTKEVAELLNVHKRTIIRYVQSGKLSGYKIGVQYMIPENEVKRFLEENKTN